MFLQSPDKRIPKNDLKPRTKQLQKAIDVYMTWIQTYAPGVSAEELKTNIMAAAKDAGMGCTIVPGYVCISYKNKYREYSQKNPLGMDTTRFKNAPKPRGKKK